MSALSLEDLIQTELDRSVTGYALLSVSKLKEILSSTNEETFFLYFARFWEFSAFTNGLYTPFLKPSSLQVSPLLS
jgi:hypothetical protein